MGIRHYRPTSPGRRQGSVSDSADLTDPNKKPEKSLLRPKPKKGGRNNQGFTCTRFRGGGHKRMYRLIDFKRDKDNVWATVAGIEVSPTAAFNAYAVLRPKRLLLTKAALEELRQAKK